MLQVASRLLYGAVAGSNVIRAATVHSPVVNLVRKSSVFGSMDSGRLWEGVTGPPGQTKKRSRGKRRVTRTKIDLNLGQVIGLGKKPMVWPGLNAPPTSQIKEGRHNEDHYDELLKYRNQRAKKRKKIRLSPLERGWSGGKRGGETRLPPPGEPGVSLSDFTATILESKMVSTMTATKGRSGRFSILVVLGNSKGVAGFGVGKAPKLHVAVQRASIRASHNLEYFTLYDNNRTLWHNAHKKAWHTNIFVKTMPEGYGLVCHRVIKSICKSIGIQDLYAKVETCTRNYQQITKGFFAILREQESYQELANREQLYVVERAVDRDNYPRILASPEQGFTREVDPEEDLNLTRYYYGGRVPYIKVRPKPGYLKGAGQMKRARERYRYRNQEKARLEREMYNALRPDLHERQPKHNV